MHYYVKYFLNDEEYRIKHFEVNDEEKQMIKDFIKQIEADGYTNFCVKRSLTPMASLTKLPGILPFLNVADEEQFNKLEGEVITSKFKKI